MFGEGEPKSNCFTKLSWEVSVAGIGPQMACELLLYLVMEIKKRSAREVQVGRVEEGASLRCSGCKSLHSQLYLLQEELEELRFQLALLKGEIRPHNSLPC